MCNFGYFGGKGVCGCDGVGCWIFWSVYKSKRLVWGGFERNGNCYLSGLIEWKEYRVSVKGDWKEMGRNDEVNERCRKGL